MNQPRNYTAPALEKGLEVLELLADRGRPMTLARISVELGRSKSELYRMLAVLEEKNYLAREEGSDHFHLTNRLFDLGMSVPPVGSLAEAAFPVMHALVDSIRQPCHLAVVSAHRMVVIARVENPSGVGVSVRVGHSLNLFESGSGYVLLAWMPEARKSAAYAHFEKHCAAFSGAPTEAELETIRRQGYLRMESSLAQGVEDMACPVFIGERQEAIASLTVPYLKGRDAPVGAETVLDRLREAGRELSALAGSYGGF